MAADSDADSVSVPTGKVHRFVLGPKVECSELSGPHFAFDRTFIRPQGVTALGGIAETLLAKPGKQAAIFGHTDTVGDEAYNKTLSERRAKIVYAALTHDPEPWEERYSAEHWGIHAIQVMLNASQPPEDKSPRLAEDGIDGPLTRAAIERFQDRSGLPASGAADKATRSPLFVAYFKSSIEEPVPKDRFLDLGGSKFMGCGEYNPFTKGVADDESRRVVVILFSPAVAPSGLPCALGDVGPCKANLRGDADPPVPNDKTPHFRCKVYRGISERCPCGPGVELAPFRVQLHDEVYTPCPDLDYRLTLPSGSAVHGKTDKSGWLRNAVPKGKQVIAITYKPKDHDEELTVRVRLTDADAESDEAFLFHLRNFGFTHEDDSDAGAVLRFQAAKGIELTGTLDDPTKDAIRKIIGGGDESMREVLREDKA